MLSLEINPPQPHYEWDKKKNKLPCAYMLKEKIYSSNCFALDWVIKAFADSAFNRQKSLWNKETTPPE